MQLLDNDSFLKQLSALFESSKNHGSIWLTCKRLTHDGEDAAMKPAEGEPDTQEYPCLLRVTDGGQNKFSTRVQPGELDRFHSAFGALLKTSMTTLRKRDKKREKLRSEQAARRKRRMTEPIAIEGPKRGSGRKKRQRRIKAAVKQQEAQLKAKERETAREKLKSA